MNSLECNTGTERLFDPQKTVTEIIIQNQQLWQLTDPNEFEFLAHDWTSSIYTRLTKLRGDTASAPHVSVVIPAFNEEKAILLLLESLARQKGIQNVEILIVANNCTDRTVDFVKKCGAQIIEKTGDHFKGVARARQKGLEKAKGQYIVSTDSDTVVNPMWIKSLVSPLEENQNIFATTGKVYYYDRNDPFLLLYSVQRDHMRAFLRHLPGKVDTRATGANMAFRRDDAIMIGGYDERKIVGEDRGLGGRLSEFGRVFFISNDLASVWTSARRFVGKGPLEMIGNYFDVSSSLYVRNGEMINIRR